MSEAARLSDADRAWQAATEWTPPPDVWRQWVVDAARLLLAPSRALAGITWTPDRAVAAVALGVPAVSVARWLPHVTWSGWAGLREGLAALAVMFAVALVATAPRPSRPAVGGEYRYCGPGGRTAMSGSSGTRTCPCGMSGGERAIRAHELGHQRAIRRAGAGGSTVKWWRNADGSWSGVTSPHSWRRIDRLPPAKQIAIDAAGIVAAPNTTSPNDGQNINATLATVPPADRDQVLAEGMKLARRWAR